MSNQPDVFDSRAEFWKRHFELADDYQAYLDKSKPDQAARWTEFAANLPKLTDEQIGRLRGFNRRLHVLVYSGVWCGDCVRQGPMLKRIADAAGDSVVLRVIDRDASDELKGELRILGGARVPVVVFLSEDFFEVGRFGDRLLSAYRDKARRELGSGASCPTGLLAPPPNELAAEQGDWVDVFERTLLMVRVSAFLRKRHND